MAMIDYGAIVRINGKFINKNKDIFTPMKDFVGFSLNEFDGNYYAYAGNKILLLCFRRYSFNIISDGGIKFHRCGNFNSESTIINGVKIKIQCLDKEYRVNREEIDYNDKNYYTKKGWIRYIKRLRKLEKKRLFKYKSNRWLVSWEYKEDKYEVIFGYGIESKENVWNKIKFDGYDFSEAERNIIDKWFIE